MKLVNTTGMAIIGPGSEWFWAMLQFVALAITFYGIYRQVRAQRSAAVHEQLAAWHRDWDDEQFRRYTLDCLLDLENRDVAEGLPNSAGRVANWFERLGYLVAQGHVRPDDVWNDFRPNIGWWWTTLSPYVERQRAKDEWPVMFEWFEDLERRMERIDVRKTGKRFADNETVTQAIDRRLISLQRERDLTQGTLPARNPGPEPASAAH